MLRTLAFATSSLFWVLIVVAVGVDDVPCSGGTLSLIVAQGCVVASTFIDLFYHEAH